MLKKRSTALQIFDDAGDAIGGALSAVPIDDAVDVVGDLVDDLGEVAMDVVEATASTAVSTGRLGIRFVTGTVRFVVRHPREVLAGIALVAIVAGVLGYLKQRDSGPSTT